MQAQRTLAALRLSHWTDSNIQTECRGQNCTFGTMATNFKTNMLGTFTIPEAPGPNQPLLSETTSAVQQCQKAKIPLGSTRTLTMGWSFQTELWRWKEKNPYYDWFLSFLFPGQSKAVDGTERENKHCTTTSTVTLHICSMGLLSTKIERCNHFLICDWLGALALDRSRGGKHQGLSQNIAEWKVLRLAVTDAAHLWYPLILARVRTTHA